MDLLDHAVLLRIFTFKRACRFATLSSMALLFYDYIITFPAEVDLVWKSPRSTAKNIFYLNRYFSLLFCVTYTALMFDAHPSTATCKAAFDLQAWSGWVGCVMVELLLQFWVNAVYRPKRRYMILMATLYIILSTASAIGLVLALRKVHVEIEMPGCALATLDETEIMKTLMGVTLPRVPPLMFACLIPSVVYELCLLALLVRKAIQFYRGSLTSRCKSRNPVAVVLMRDSVTYFIIILAAYLANALIWTFAPSQLFQIGVGFGITLPSLLGSRLLLNLRDAHRRAHRFTPTVSLSHSMSHWDQLFGAEPSVTLPVLNDTVNTRTDAEPGPIGVVHAA